MTNLSFLYQGVTAIYYMYVTLIMFLNFFRITVFLLSLFVAVCRPWVLDPLSGEEGAEEERCAPDAPLVDGVLGPF